MKKELLSLAVVSALSLGFTGCGSGSGDGSNNTPEIKTMSGVFSDSKISGVTYKCGSSTGLTDINGTFTYTEECSNVEFSIGSIVVGSINTANIAGDGTVYPADLLSLDRNETNSTVLVNMLQVLQSLDSDNNPNNGITIDENTTSSLTGISEIKLDSNTTTASDLTTIVDLVSKSLINRDHAIAHYEDTLRKDLNISVDTVAPAPAIVASTIEDTTLEIFPVTINGEVGAKVLIDGIDSNITINSNNEATINLDISDIALNTTDIESKDFNITLKDDTNKTSDFKAITLKRYNQVLRDNAEVTAIKTAMNGLDANESRSYTYNQQWNTGDNYNITFSESTRTQTVEDQTYDVITTISKGTSTDSVTFSEFIPYSQELRDIAEVVAIKSGIENNPRGYNHTRLWDTGDTENTLYSEFPRTQTVENQTYDVNVTITKGTALDTITFSETIPFSQSLRDIAEVASIKTLFSTLNNRDSLSYTQQWTTGDNYNVTYDINKRSATTEDQTYNVTATILKGDATESVTFSETIPFSQSLRDIAEVNSIKSSMNGLNSNESRTYTYTQQWSTGDNYNIVFSELPRSQSTENQTYDVTATILKGDATDTVTFSESIPFSQDLRDEEEINNIKIVFNSLNNRDDFTYTQQWNTGTNYSISYDIDKKIPTAIDQEYFVTVDVIKGNESDTFTFTELVPTTNVNIDFSNGATALVNDEYVNEYSITDGGIFYKTDQEDRFVGSALALDPTTLSSSVTTSSDLLNYMVTNSNISGLNSISVNNAQDGSLTARYEIGTSGYNLYELLESLLASINYSINDIVYENFTDINNSFVDFYIEYDSNSSYALITLTDKTLEVDSDITKVVNKDSIVESNEAIVNEQETFTFNATQPKGDFLFVIDDSGSMSQEQAAAIESIGRTFASSTEKYNLDWKASVVGTSYNNTYSTLLSNPSYNDINKTKEQLDLGTSGSGTETGVKRAYLSIIDGLIDIRESSSLTAIYVSDEPCHTSLSEIGSPNSNLSDSYFVQNNIRFNTIMSSSDQNENDLAYRMTLATGGDSANLYNYDSGYDAMMDLAIRYAVAKSSSVKIAYPALASSISVHVNGTKTTQWEYDPSEKAIVFEYNSMPSQDDNITVTYSHLDYSSMVASAKSEFEALDDSVKRSYTNDNIDVSFDPVSPIAPLTDQDQTYNVTVTFSKFGYEETSTFTETVSQVNFSVDSNTDWLQDGVSFTSQNHSNSSTSTLTITFGYDGTINYSVSSEGCYDKLSIKINDGTSTSYCNGSSGSVNVSNGDVVEFTYSKDGSSSSGTDSATVEIQ